jgi:hypothetical protein
MSQLRRVAATLAATAVALSPSLLGSAQAVPPPLPHDDPFYSYATNNGGDTTPLADQPAGTVLGTPRSVNVTLAGNTVPAEQLLYRTQDEQGNPSVTVTTVINPAGAAKGIVGYLSYYDALGDQCDPSYTLQYSPDANESKVIGLLAQGYAVTVPDFEGETADGTKLHWAAGHESGWSTLDAVRATESWLSSVGQGSGAATKVGLLGYSGGSIAGEWATELQPTYAPELKLVGTAIGGIPANLGHVLQYVDGSNDWSGVIPAAMVSLANAYGEDLRPWESTTLTYPAGAPTMSGQDITDQVSNLCIGSFADDYPGLRFQDLVNPADSTQMTSAVNTIVGKLVMGTGGVPKAPMMMLNGNKDGTGDGIMVAADVKALAAKYCSEGDAVQYTEVPGADHTTAGSQFMLRGLLYLGQRFLGEPAPSTCRVAPAPVVKHAIHPKLHARSQAGRDILVVKADGARGATVKFFRLHHGHQIKVGHGVIDKHGKVTIKVVDPNGSAKTRYRAKVAATTTALAATTRVVTQR